MTIIGIAGAIGSGKSFTQLKHGLKYVEERQKQLVTNFAIDIKALHRYASMPEIYNRPLGWFFTELRKLVYGLKYSLWLALPKYFKKPRKLRFKPQLPWVKYLCENGGIVQIPAPKNLQALLIPESVVLLDEAGILLNSRDFANTPKELLADLAQSRKTGTDLIWCAQFEEQVDRQMRMLTQFWIHCLSLSVFDKKMRRPSLKWKRIHWFSCSDYQRWLSDPRAYGSYVKTKFAYATMSEEGLLSYADLALFGVYDSFSRLDRAAFGDLSWDGKVRVVSRWKCDLPRDYYFGKVAIPEHDPFSRKYQPIYGWYWRNSKSVKATKMLAVKSVNLLAEIDGYERMDAIESQGVCLDKLDRTRLIAGALSLSRSRGVKPPYFKLMSDAEIRDYISGQLA